MSDTAARPLLLKSREERRIRAGHLWVFSNEIDTDATPLKAFEPGEIAQLQAHNGRFVGWCYVNPNSLICARILGRDARHPPSVGMIVHRLQVALALRERLFDGDNYRLVYGEADGLPGLVVDRYGKTLVAQISTAGMEAMRDDIVEALTRVLQPTGILLNNRAHVRELEHLPRYVEVAAGEVPESVSLSEGGATFQVPLAEGQKTGWFFDQTGNRARLAALAGDASVLDVCCYIGGFGIQAAVNGAREVTCVDSSQGALDGVTASAAQSGVADKVTTLRGDAFEALAELKSQDRRFDIVIVDPPAFVRRKKDLKAGLLAYRRLNERAMRLLSRDGLLVSCSCSHFVSGGQLIEIVGQAARHLDRNAQVFHHGGQHADHPIHPAIAESRYLDALFCRIVRD